MSKYFYEKKENILTYGHPLIAIDPDGRITDLDLGLLEDGQIQQLKQLVDKCHAVGKKVAIQIAHAGRKSQDATNMHHKRWMQSKYTLLMAT